MRGRPNHPKACVDCGQEYMPTSNRQQSCPACGVRQRSQRYQPERRIEPSRVEQLTAVLRYGPLTTPQIRIRLRHVPVKSVSAAIQEARLAGLVERRPDEGWALVDSGA